MVLLCAMIGLPIFAWPGMPMPVLHVDGRYLKDENGNIVNLHGFGQTYSPWFNERGTKWNNYDVQACLKYNKEKIDRIMAAGWKMNWLRLHMDPYWSNTPGVHTNGESDISAFDFNRFRTYLQQVFIPMAEYAISKGMYVVMRPPGVCPEEIAIGDAYHKYLKQVWGFISSIPALKSNPHIMFELANEPVRIQDTDGEYRSNTDGCNKNLTQFFQEIVDIMRNNGCENILWIPGTGYQSQYAGFAKYPIQGKNIGYAVHVYPGWYGSDAMEPSAELGGSYGGGFQSFASGWAAQIEPCAAIAPIIVTEMDWAPKKYDASWGKSITGKMLGNGFGGNFKVLADRTGNVSWMIFTGPELLCQYNGIPGQPDNYTLFNDPEACIWPVYHWYEEYAGEKLPAPSTMEVCYSPRTMVPPSSLMIMTGDQSSVEVIGTNDGYERNLDCGLKAEIDDPNILKWNNRRLETVGVGVTTVKLSYNYNGENVNKKISVDSDPFPFKDGYFNPSIYSTGSFDASSHTITTGQYGFAGWKYSSGLDLSNYNYLFAELGSNNPCQVSFRVFDNDNYWSDPAIMDFNNSKIIKFDLHNLVSNNGRKMDPSHLRIVGFWSLGGQPFVIKRVWAHNDPSAIEDMEMDEENQPVDVYNANGILVRSKVNINDAIEGLPAGLYIIGNKKIIIR